MPSLLGNILGTDEKSAMSNQVIANDMMAGSKAAAGAYLNATLEAATPELRALYSGSLNEIMTAHAGMTQLAIDKRWYKPYDMVEQQLADVYEQSVSLTDDRNRE